MELLFSITILELLIGGGGRLTPIGPVTLRMVLFATCLCAWLVVAPITRQRRSNGHLLAIGLVLSYLFIHISAFIVGLLKGTDVVRMNTEMQQSLYWLAAPFFAFILQSQAMVQRTAIIIQVAGIILATTYIAAITGLAIGAIDLVRLYPILNETGEFYFRGESFFFYKGFLYLGISIVFLIAIRGRHWGYLTTLVAGALVLTLTRGFVLSTSIAILLMLIAQRQWRAVSIASLSVIAAALLVWVYLPTVDDTLLGQRDISTSQREDDMAYIVDNISAKTIILGEGLGSLINNRPNIENTFLWAIWKLGYLGFMFWIIPLIICTYYYLKVSKNNSQHRLACAYFFGTILVYVQTATNPYLNNPIGLSFLLMALFSLKTIATESTLTEQHKCFPKNDTEASR
jgi:hypothetical protein